jgi:hypothetical protein
MQETGDAAPVSQEVMRVTELVVILREDSGEISARNTSYVALSGAAR